MVDDADAVVDRWKRPDAGAAGEGGCCAQENGWEDTSWEWTTQEYAGFHISRPTGSSAGGKFWTQGGLSSSVSSFYFATDWHPGSVYMLLKIGFLSANY